jgi:hypothetical protein
MAAPLGTYYFDQILRLKDVPVPACLNQDLPSGRTRGWLSLEIRHPSIDGAEIIPLVSPALPGHLDSLFPI